MTDDVGTLRGKGPQGKRRGQGARERILAAALHLFREQGINSTGMEQLCAEAHASKRTAYQYFSSKDELITEYLRALDTVPIAAFDRADLAPQERLLAVFEEALEPEGAPLCPFIGAAVEIADPSHPARGIAREYKRSVTERLSQIAEEAGAAEPELLGERLALLLDGASARTRTLGANAMPTAIDIAKILIQSALAEPVTA